VDANGNVTLNFFANYRALASGVRPGLHSIVELIDYAKLYELI
ncbi:hypothetical protein ACUOA5_22975, partial [Escherichia coli]